MEYAENTFRDLNAVAISPLDGKAYGAILHYATDTWYLIRFDSTRMEFLEQLSNTDDDSSSTAMRYGAAAFTPQGDLYFSLLGVQKQYMHYYDGNALVAMEGKLDYTTVGTYTGTKTASSGIGITFHDFSIVSGDWETPGTTENYAFGIKANKKVDMINLDTLNSWSLSAISSIEFTGMSQS